MFNPFEILRGIDPDGIVYRFKQLDPVAMLERAQLLELLTLLERCRLKMRKLEQKATLIAINA